MKVGLVCLDLIREIIDHEGKLASKGYSKFAERHGTLAAVAERQALTRAAGGHVIHVHLGFVPGYEDHPAGSRLLGGARTAGILKLGTSSTTLHPAVAPAEGDIVLVKKRMSPFRGTSLELVLRSLGIQSVVLAGVSTDLAVESAARDAHDLDFDVTVAADCCAAASDEEHEWALATMGKFATIG